MVTSIFKTPKYRYSFIILLIACLSCLTIYVSMKYSRAQRLRNEVNQLLAIRENSSQIDSCILILYSADNDTRLYSATGEANYLKKFVRQIKEVDSILEQLNAAKERSVRSSSQKISGLMDSKNIKTQDYLRLRRLADSLIGVALHQKKLALKKAANRASLNAARDTIIQPKKKKFFGRIFSVFSNKDKEAMDTTVIAANAAIVSPADPGLTSSPSYYKKLYTANAGMRKKEREMLLVNSGIIQELISVLKRYKEEEHAYVAARKQELQGNLNTVFLGFSQLSVVTGIVVVLSLVALLYNLWKIFRYAKHLTARSEKANQLAADKSTFLANMSHEIRTPLNSIVGFSEQLEKSPLSQEQSGQIKAIRSSGEMLLKIVNQVLDFSKHETGKMNFEHASFQLHKIVSDVTISLGILAQKKGIRLVSETHYEDDLHLCGDALRLRQVIMNLVGNAIKFTQKGEVVLKVWTTTSGNHQPILHVSVKDTGIGISQKELPGVFEEFTQAGSNQKQHHAGTGLGLAISKSIVEQQGGTINVESEVGKGSVFSFSIPFESGVTVLANTETNFDEQESRELLKNKRILLAEDNIMNVMLAKTILRKWDMICEVANNGKEALALFESNEYDLVLTDIHMPEMGGVELALLIRQAKDQDKANVPILALTASVMSEDHELYLGSGINAIASKPFLERELIHKIGSVIKTFGIEINQMV
jgi:signal transduction histidine kinase/CheY-like chemotaxis protein